MGLNPGSPGFSMPPAEDDQVRKLRDAERTARENAAARTLEASQIGKGGIRVTDGGSITVEAPGTIDLLGGAFAAATIAASSSVTAGGTVQGLSVIATGNMVAANMTANGLVRGDDVYTINGPTGANNFTGGRVAAWLQTADGKVGNTASSRRFKTNIVDSGIDPLAVLGIGVKHYNFIAEIRKRDDPTYEHYVGPEYHVVLEVGDIAEDLHDAGLWEFVVYERNDDDSLKLDASGEPIPRSIHYELWSLAVQVAVQFVWAEHQKVRVDVDRILTHLGLDN